MGKTVSRGARTAALVFALALALVQAARTARAADTVEPRPFGYTVGDVLERRILIDPQRDGTLDASSLPKPGRFGRWFALRAALAQPDGVRLVYQIVDSPGAAQRENLPSLRLQVDGRDGRPHPVDVGPFTVSLAPVALGPLGDEGSSLPPLRPDLDPPPVPTQALQRRVTVLAIALAVLLALLWLLPLVRRRLALRTGPFMRAWRAMRRAPTALQAMRALHAALDEAAGATLALDNVERLFAARPQLGPARGEVESLLAASRAAFFGGAEAPARERSLALARRLAELDAQPLAADAAKAAT